MPEIHFVSRSFHRALKACGANVGKTVLLAEASAPEWRWTEAAAATHPAVAAPPGKKRKENKKVKRDEEDKHNELKRAKKAKEAAKTAEVDARNAKKEADERTKAA